MSRLHVESGGEGFPLIMLHGLFGSADNFRTVAAQLEQHFNVVRIDLPGHGQSPRLTDLSPESMAMAVLDELDHINVKQFHLLGHSLGGKVAMCMAANPRCQGLQRLIVVDIAPKDYPPHHAEILGALKALDLQSLSSRSSADQHLSSSITDAGIRAFLLKSLHRDKTNGFTWRFDLDQLEQDYPQIARAPQLLEQIQQPTLFIKGGNSDYLQSADRPIIEHAFVAPSVKVMVGAGHWPHAEKPEQFVRICNQFLAE